MEAASIRGKQWRFLGSLHHADFRTYWASLVLYVFSFQTLQVALLWVIYDLTDSPLYLGWVGGSMAVSSIAVTLFGGVVADRMDRRNLIILATGFQAVVMGGLAVLAMADSLLPWHLLLAAALLGIGGGMAGPARQAIVPNLVPRGDLMNAVALSSAVWSGTRIVGPAIGGVVIDLYGSTIAFAAVGAGFLISNVLMLPIRTSRLQSTEPSETFLQQLISGLDFIRRNSLFSSLIGMTFFNSFFGMSYIFLMPIFATEMFGLGASGMGILMGASALGALGGTILVAVLGKEQHHNTFLIGGAAIFGSTLVLFAYLHLLPIPSLTLVLPLLARPISLVLLFAIAVLVVSGAVNSAYMIVIMTVLQTAVPDELRGRVMGVHGLTWSLMPLGGQQAGIMANYFGAPFAVALGGGAVILYTMAVVARRGFRRRVATATTASG